MDRLAAHGDGCEVIGFFYHDPVADQYRVHRLPAEATRDWFHVPPPDVVAFTYMAADIGWHIVGTVHTHPGGAEQFSQRDLMLCDWADWHLLLYLRADAWGFHWAKRVRCEGRV